MKMTPEVRAELDAFLRRTAEGGVLRPTDGPIAIEPFEVTLPDGTRAMVTWLEVRDGSAMFKAHQIVDELVLTATVGASPEEPNPDAGLATLDELAAAGVTVIEAPPFGTRGDLYQLEHGGRGTFERVPAGTLARVATIAQADEAMADRLRQKLTGIGGAVIARPATSRDRDAAARGANVAAGYAPPPPEPGERCPRCHHRAPRADGIPCALCCPMVMTTGDRWLTPAAPYDLRTRDVLVLAHAVGDGTRTRVGQLEAARAERAAP